MALVEALKDERELVRIEAAYALKDIKPTNPSVFLALDKALTHEEDLVREKAAQVLGAIKPAR